MEESKNQENVSARTIGTKTLTDVEIQTIGTESCAMKTSCETLNGIAFDSLNAKALSQTINYMLQDISETLIKSHEQGSACYVMVAEEELSRAISLQGILSSTIEGIGNQAER